MTTQDMAERAMALACADEILMRVAPAALRSGPGGREAVAEVLIREKRAAVQLLIELADALDGRSEVNVHTGEIATVLPPDYFGRLRRVVEQHTGRPVLAFARREGRS